MIKINLALRKQSGVNAPATLGGSLGKLDLAILKELPIKKVLVPIVIGYVATTFLDNYKQEQVEILVGILNNNKAGTVKLQADLTKYKDYDVVKKTLEEDETTVKAKLETIKTLISGRAAPLKMMNTIAKVIPKNVWLTEINMDKKGFAIKGGSLDFSLISDFMKSLKESDIFSGVDLIDTQQIVTERSEIATFDLKLGRK